MTCHEKFFEQHAKRFHHRPFIWHVWDGLKDGKGINDHRLTQAVKIAARKKV